MFSSMLKHTDKMFDAVSLPTTFSHQRTAFDGGRPVSPAMRPTKGSSPLRVSAPERFSELVRHYGVLLDRAVDQRMQRSESSLSAELRDLSARLGRHQASARDAIELHDRALELKLASAPPLLTRAYLEEGHILVLELMGYLLSYYRTAFLQAMPPSKGS